MILDTGICTIFRKTDVGLPGQMPLTGMVRLCVGWYKELNYETAPNRPTEGRKELKTDARIRILQDRRIRQNDVVVLEVLKNFEDRTAGAPVYKITRAYHGEDDDGPTMITDLSLEVVTP